MTLSGLLKPFEEMTPEDYAEIGLRSGLEVHQQLLTDRKLFCRCPAGLYNTKEYDAEILRHMRPTLSELGEYDGTALMEFKTRKEIIYRINHQSVCTYEMDDTPPFEINQQALDIALQLAMVMNYKLVSEIHIARKQYLDGSIPTGFQRTTIVGIDGWLPYKGRKIGLVQLGLEEDSCREVSDIGHERIYITDRLGMPITEVVTEPVMRTPQEVADVCNIIRYVSRSTGRVRTGLGAAREDVNVSIAGGTRIEIKGVHRIKLIPRLIYHEAQRQYSLLKIRDELRRRGITPDTFQYEWVDVTSYLMHTTWEPIQRAIHKRQEMVACVNLKGFLGILSYPTQTGTVFSKEISDRVRVIACLTRQPNILTSESTEVTIGNVVWNRIRKAVRAQANDALILVWGSSQDVKTAIDEIAIRAREATLDCPVPSETRQALDDGTNGFERILPGPERMYPDTDLPPLEITPQRIENLAEDVPEQMWVREDRYREWGVPEHLLVPIASSMQAELFESLVKTFNRLSPVRIARLMFEKTVAWRREGLDTSRLTEAVWQTLFTHANTHPPLVEAAETLLETFLKSDGTVDLATQIHAFLLPSIDEATVKDLLQQELAVERPYTSPAAKHHFIMGNVMKQCRGKIAGAVVNQLLNEYLS
ncbi:MAG: Glu-tRNA(Gln) amidotransferase GatDE subunit E [Gemmatimonadetes bacterium]|nr:MAG: Glu-tRNA(Gln) amidotransferase GatDE subunit E [Gemmatimonadota bacterium]